MSTSVHSDPRTFSDGMTLGQARAKLRTLVDDGYECPCCTQMAKVYRRKINTAMAATLLRIFHAVGGRTDEFVHTPSLPGDTHEASQLAWWGLVEEESGVRRDDGGRAGWWRLTDRGAAFARGEISVPKYARVYDHALLQLVGESVDIHDCLGTRFNYRDLMEGR